MKSQGIPFIVFLSAFILYSATCLGQDDDYRPSPESGAKPAKKTTGFSWDKVYMGGGLGLQFGTVTMVDISPTLGYRINENLSAGLGLTYVYYEVSAYNYSTNVYGGGPFARYVFARNLFAHVEYQILNSEYYLVDQSNRIVGTFRENVHYFWVGGGLRRELGRNSYLVLMGLYDINHSDLSIYPSNPILRAGVVVGL